VEAIRQGQVGFAKTDDAAWADGLTQFIDRAETAHITLRRACCFFDFQRMKQENLAGALQDGQPALDRVGGAVGVAGEIGHVQQ
jgi:hypothetical protein